MTEVIFKDEQLLPYSIGALLYSPANNRKIADDIMNGKIPTPYSLAMCLEDAISDLAVTDAETVLVNTLHILHKEKQQKKFYLPKIFIRVRAKEQIQSLYERLEDAQEILTGFIFPKFSDENGKEYCEEIAKINETSRQKVYMMPILESQNIVNLDTRSTTLYNVKELLDEYKEYVLNVRVGGNDFCKNFGIRRHMDETIYDIRLISNILSDILTCFSRDYVVSGPVWEYFGPHNGTWEKGMLREVKLDKLNGFLGKTVIHPTQIAVVNEMLKVTKEDYEDALSIVKMADNTELFVEKNTTGNRMNEYKTHIVWAGKILILGKLYGVKEKCEKNIIPLSI